MRMTSFRRSTSVVQRDGISQNGNVNSDTLRSPKSSHARPYLDFGGLKHLWRNPTDSLMVLERVRIILRSVILQRYTWIGERLRSKGLHCKRTFFHFSVFFIAGILIGFTPFLTVDISKNFTSKHQAFSFETDPELENGKRKFDSVNKETLLHEKQSSLGNVTHGTVANGKIGTEAVVGSYGEFSFQDLASVPQKLLIVVTPTYARPFQAYYLNRLAHTLRAAPPPLIWIVVEMSIQSADTARILRETGVMYRHLVCNQNVTTMKDAGVYQRNVALSHIEKHHLDGMVLFTDDDRIFSVDLFDNMREIRYFGIWPVALLTESKNKVLIEGPVCNGSRVIGWHTNQRSKIPRRFHVDISGFTFNSTILWNRKRQRIPTQNSIRLLDKLQDGFQVTTFVEQLVEDESGMEGLPSGCSKIMAWHLHLEAPELVYPTGWLMQNNLEIVSPLT